MTGSAVRAARIPFLLLVLIASIYLVTARSAILDDGDALYARAAQEMVERRDWVTPYANGVRFLDKPPMMYWLMAAAYHVVGMNELAARLPSALAVLGTGFLLYWIGWKFGGHATGFTAGIAVAFCVGTFLFTRMVFPDILFVFLLTLALAAFLRWYTDPSSPAPPAMLFYGALAGAVLTKGLIGLVFPAAIVGVFLFWSRDLGRLRAFHPCKGMLLFAALALPWHVLAARRNPGFLWYFFVNEQLLRFLGRRQPIDYESVSLPLFWALLLVWLFPWSAFLPAIRHVLPASCLRDPRSRATVGVALSWAAVVLIFFSVSSRIEHYALPLLPPLALLVAIALSPERICDDQADLRRQRWVARGFASLALLGAVLGLGSLAGAAAWFGSGWPRRAVEDAAARPIVVYRYYFAPLFDLPPATLVRLAGPLLATTSVLSLGMMAAWWIDRRGMRQRAIGVLAAMMMGFFLFAFRSLGVCEEVLSSKQFGRAISALYRTDDSVVVAGDFETANSVNFYARLPIDVYGGRAAVLEWGLGYADAPRRILTRAQLLGRWTGKRRVFVIASDPQLRDLALPGAHTVLRSAGRTLLSNLPAAEARLAP